MNTPSSFAKHLRFLFVVALLLVGSTVYACSCLQKSDVQKFRDAKAVFVGVVLETRYIEDKAVFGGGYVKARVRVNEVLKGKARRAFAVSDQLPESGMCTAFLRAGVEFVLFVDDRDQVGMCTGTRPLGATVYDRDEKLMELRKLKAAASF